MKRFDLAALREGDILCGRNLVSKEGAMIRGILGSVTNHNALIINHPEHGWGIGDMSPPCGRFVPFSHYEKLIADGNYIVRILRIRDTEARERGLMSTMWVRLIQGLPYDSFRVKRLWVMRFVNSLPWHIKGTWCTRAVGLVCAQVFSPARNPFRKLYVPGMPVKVNETPRTVENRLMSGLLRDVTDRVLVGIR